MIFVKLSIDFFLFLDGIFSPTFVVVSPLYTASPRLAFMQYLILDFIIVVIWKVYSLIVNLWLWAFRCNRA